MFVDQTNQQTKHYHIFDPKKKKKQFGHNSSIATENSVDKNIPIAKLEVKKTDLTFSGHKRFNSVGYANMDTTNISNNGNNFRIIIDKKMTGIKNGFNEKKSLLFAESSLHDNMYDLPLKKKDANHEKIAVKKYYADKYGFFWNKKNDVSMSNFNLENNG